MPYVQSRIERCWNAFAFLASSAGAADVGYRRRNVWEALLFMLLTMAAGFQFARLVGIFPHDGLKPRDKSQGQNPADFGK
jgi:hypothetical protein